jgi:sigma-B regulation protein RsbU (phosphoserine phosphatase)
MKLQFNYLRASFSRRLNIIVAALASIVFIAAVGFLFIQSREAVKDEAMDRASQILNNTVLRVNSILERVEVATNNTDWLVLRHLETPDSMYVYAKSILRNNPELNGCSISFEPYYYPHKGRFFSIYGHRENGEIAAKQEGNDHYEYFFMDWYQLCKLLDRPAWTEPFLDEDPDSDYESTMIVSYCKPIKDEDGRYIGTIAADLSLSWLSETISAVKPYPHSYSFMIGQGGTFFVHPDPEKLLYQSIFTETLEQDNPERMELGLAMVHGEEGVKQLMVDGEHCYVFYKPLGNTGFSAAIVCPERDIFNGYKRLRNVVTLIFILGMLIMHLILSSVFRHEIAPLSSLAEQAETIAAGNFDQALPNTGRTDEIGRLCQSFSGMQHSLVKYIEEIKTTSAAKASIERELMVASDIQMSMVPRIFPPFPDREDIDLYASMTPAKEVGGDLYDFFVENDHLYFCIGDVSGKGVPASLFMAVTRNLFRVIAQQGHTPEEIATQINHALSADNDQGMFVTMFIGMANLKTGRLDFCNCGHNPPVICEPGKPAYFLPMQNVNTALGTWDELVFKGESIPDIHEWQILLYTDGLNEAENPKYELFGNDHLINIMADANRLDAKDIILMLQEAVEKHRDGAAPNDDLTLLSLKLRKE